MVGFKMSGPRAAFGHFEIIANRAVVSDVIRCHINLINSTRPAHSRFITFSSSFHIHSISVYLLWSSRREPTRPICCGSHFSSFFITKLIASFQMLLVLPRTKRETLYSVHSCDVVGSKHTLVKT